MRINWTLSVCLTTLIFCFLSNQLFSQSGQVHKSRFDKFIFGGPNLGYLRGTLYFKDPERYQQPNIGFTIGVGTNYTISDRFVLSTMLMMEEKGSTLHISYNGGQIVDKYNITFQDFTLCLLSVYKLGRARNIGIGAGSFLSYLYKNTVDTYSYPPPQYFPDDQTWENVDFEFGISVMVEYKININPNFSLDLKLLNQLGLTNTKNSKKYPVYGVLKTNATALLVGINYSL